MLTSTSVTATVLKPGVATCQRSAPCASARLQPNLSALCRGTRKNKRDVLQVRHRTGHRLCAASAAKKKKADAEPAEEPLKDPEHDSEPATDGEAEPPAESPLVKLFYKAIEAGSASEAASHIAEADELYNSATSRADAAEISALATQATCEGLNDKYLRLSAEFENYRKRSAVEKTSALKKSKARVIEDLLPVVDAFEAAAGQVKAETEGEQKIAASYQGLYAKLVDGFKKMGLEIVPGVGTPFDPEVHEAIMRAPDNEQPEGTVLQEFRRGFRIDGTLLRAAMVQVSYIEDEVPEAKEADA